MTNKDHKPNFKPNVIVGKCLATEKNPIELCEILKGGKVVEWEFLDSGICELNKKKSFKVGELFLDWINTSVAVRNSTINDSIRLDNGKTATEEDIKLARLAEESLEYIRAILIDGDVERKRDLYLEFVNEYNEHYSQSTIKISPFGDGKLIGNKYEVTAKETFDGVTNDSHFENAFFITDLYHLINNNDVTVRECAYCGKLFVKSSNTKYCPQCKDERIPDKLKRQNAGTTASVRKKIYQLLTQREDVGHNSYFHGELITSASFSSWASSQKKLLSADDYLNWLESLHKELI